MKQAVLNRLEDICSPAIDMNLTGCARPAIHTVRQHPGGTSNDRHEHRGGRHDAAAVPGDHAAGRRYDLIDYVKYGVAAAEAFSIRDGRQ